MSANLQVRRATVDDLPRLIALWQMENLPWQDLEKRFREFQIVLAADGELLGALGIQTSGTDGHLHTEVFAHPEQSDALREMLWQRVQTVASNHALLRLWTQIEAPFWHGIGFQLGTAEQLARIPSGFGNAVHPWRFLQFKEETATPLSIEKEFAMFREAEQERTQRLMQRARVLKILATFIGIALFILVMVWAVMFFKARGQLPPP
jgi:N-acetylglutamate synthase-like GNAT family acetyltransferase